MIWAVIDDYLGNPQRRLPGCDRRSARRDTQVRTAVLGSVLDGSLGDGPALWEAATVLGLPHQGTFLVVAAEPGDGATSRSPGWSSALRAREVGSAWRLDADRQVGMLHLPRAVASRRCVPSSPARHRQSRRQSAVFRS